MRSGERWYGIGVLAAVVLGAGGATAQTTTWSRPLNYTGAEVAAIDASGRKWVGTANSLPYRGDFATGLVERIPFVSPQSIYGSGVGISGDGTGVLLRERATAEGGSSHGLRTAYGVWLLTGVASAGLSHDGREAFVAGLSYPHPNATGDKFFRDGIWSAAPSSSSEFNRTLFVASVPARWDRLVVSRGWPNSIAQIYERSENRYVDLPRLPDEAIQSPLSVSPEGRVIVGVSTMADSTRAMWLWRDGMGTQFLGPAPVGQSVSARVCAEGRSIYLNATPEGPSGRVDAFVYQEGIFRSLIEVLNAEGASLPPGITSCNVRDVSHDGSVLLLIVSHPEAFFGERLLVRRSSLASPVVTLVDTVPSREGCTIRVRFGANAGIEAGALDAGDIEIRTSLGELLPVGLVGATTLDANRVVGTYSFVVPGGQWDIGASGEYQVWVRSGAVADVRGITTPLQLAGRFSYPFNSPSVSAEDASAPDGGTAFQAVVLYEDPVGSPAGVSWASVGTGDVVLNGPAGYAESGRLTSRATPGSGAVLAAYQFPSRGAYWDWTDSGAYALTLREGEVWDEQGNLAPGGVFGTYPLAFQTPWAGVAAVTARAGHSDLRVTMTYRANGRFMSWGSLGAGDLELRGDRGFASQSTLVSRWYNSVNNSYTVVYSLPARGGAWDSSDNGVYSLWFREGQVWDSLGYAIPGVQMGSYPLRF